MKLFLRFLWNNVGIIAIAAIALFTAIAFAHDAPLTVLTGSWSFIATVSSVTYIYLLGVAVGRLNDRDIESRRKTDPVRVLAYAHVRNNTLWVVAMLMCAAIGILEFVRYAFVPNMDIPSGLSIGVIYWFLCTGAAIGLLNKRDDEYVEVDQPSTVVEHKVIEAHQTAATALTEAAEAVDESLQSYERMHHENEDEHC